MPERAAGSTAAAIPANGSAAAAHEPWIGLAAILSITVYFRAPWTFFAADDIVHLSRAAGLLPWNGPYRPLSEGLAFWIQYRIFGLDPVGYHLANLGLHLANVAGVYWLCLRLLPAPRPAFAAAVLFGCSSFAFTPLHWATGNTDLLACALLLGATHVHMTAARRGMSWRWLAALLGLAAMGSKEVAVTWPAWVAWIEWRTGCPTTSPRTRLWRVIPSIAASALFLSLLAAAGHFNRLRDSAAYAVAPAPGPVLQNLLTYLGWIAARWESIPDRVAAADPRAWPIGIALLGVTLLGLARTTPAARRAASAGLIWFLAFLLPVLPLAAHAHLYYLYVPWAGGAIAVASIGAGLLARFRLRAVVIRALAVAGLALFVVVEATHVARRESASRHGLPVDRVMREALLLRNALPALKRADLAPGSLVGFVNPVPGPRFDLMSGSTTRPGDEERRVSYWALEGAMHGGATLRLFAPGLEYRGFAATIPADWQDVECFHFEQRGWLEHWGRGIEALLHQARVQIAAARWSAADRTLVRLRGHGAVVTDSIETRLRAFDRTGGAATDTLLRRLRAGARTGAERPRGAG